MASPQDDDTRTQIQRGLDELRRLRDQIRLEIHLANMDAKDMWNQLEPRVMDAENMAKDITETSRKAIQDLAGSLRRFRESLSPPHEPARGG